MDDHLDEKILSIKEILLGTEEKAKQEEADELEVMMDQIRDLEVTHNDLNLEMVQESLFNGKFKIYVPCEFVLMTPKQIKVKYPHDDRPLIVYMNKKNNINISVNHLPDELSDDDVMELRNVMKQVHINVNPNEEILDEGGFKVSGKTIGYYAFTSAAIGGQMYNLMFITSFEETVLSCNLNCLMKESESLKLFFYGIMRTIEFTD